MLEDSVNPLYFTSGAVYSTANMSSLDRRSAVRQFFSLNLFPARAVYVRDGDVIGHEQLVSTSFPFLSIKKNGSFPVAPRAPGNV